jgi:hypothetical protein
MQAPAHSFIPDGQAPPHEAPSQVAAPPIGAGQAAQDDPHDVTSVLAAHSAPHG